MTFPTSNISADSIRYELARDNTAGAQTPVSLNDGPVRAAANRNSGAVSYNDLRGVNVLWSGTLTFDYRSIAVGPGNYVRFAGYDKNFPPSYGGAIGSLTTTSYYRQCDAQGGGVTPLSSLGLSQNATTVLFFDADVSPFPSSVSTLYVTIDNVRYTLTPPNYYSNGWSLAGDPCNFNGRAGQTSQVVITY